MTAQRSRRLSYFVGSSSPVTSMLISAVITCLGSLTSLSFAASMMLSSFSELISLTSILQQKISFFPLLSFSGLISLTFLSQETIPSLLLLSFSELISLTLEILTKPIITPPIMFIREMETRIYLLIPLKKVPPNFKL